MKLMQLNSVCFVVLVLGVTNICGQDGFKLIYRVFDECTSNGVDPSMCLKLKLLTAMERASRSADLEVLDGIHLIKENSAKDETPLTENEIEANLPRSLDDKDKALDNMIVDKATSFFENRSVQIKLTNFNGSPRGLEDEGRSRRRRTLGVLLLLGAAIAGTLIPLKLGALALLAGKALIISKLALALAAIVGLKKLISGNQENQDSYQVVQVPHHHIRRRSLPPTLAYRAYMPKN